MADDEFDSLSSAPVPGIDVPTDGQAPADDVKTLRSELEKVTAQLHEQRNLYLRALADHENYKRRSEREIRLRSDEGRRRLLARVLQVLDNLERAAAYREASTPAEQLVDGLLATVKQFNSLLEAEGVRPIDVTGKTFDPKVAEAVGTRA